VISRFSPTALCCAAIALLVFHPVAFAQEHTSTAFQLKQTIPLPGVEGRIDHLDIDINGHRLLFARWAITLSKWST
jgi:hypothetical protein